MFSSFFCGKIGFVNYILHYLEGENNKNILLKPFGFKGYSILQTTKDDIYKGVNIFVNDGIEGLIEDKGTGIQSAVIISLFSYYCSKFHKSSSLLVVEEPEIYLHLQARRVVSNKFDEFVNFNSTNGNQVIITTHSSEFIRNTDISNIIVVKKISGKTTTRCIQIEEHRHKELTKIQNIISAKMQRYFLQIKLYWWKVLKNI